MKRLCSTDTVKNLRDTVAQKVTMQPGVYRWWFKADAARKLLAQLPAIDYGKISKCFYEEEEYFALYFGIAKNLQERLNWHIRQHHTLSSVKSGYLSTLRQSLSALLCEDMSKAEQYINKFIDNNCVVEWEDTTNRQQAEAIERNELSDASCCCYPLNIQDNLAVPKCAIQRLKELRKLSRCDKLMNIKLNKL